MAEIREKSASGWFWISLSVAAILSLLVVLTSAMYDMSVRHNMTISIATFVTSFGILMYLNPDLWYRRMAEVALTPLLGAPLLGGLTLSLPFSKSAGPFAVQIPEAPMVAYFVLAGLAVFFSLLHKRSTDAATSDPQRR